MSTPPARAARPARALAGPALVVALLAAACSGGDSPAGPPEARPTGPATAQAAPADPGAFDATGNPGDPADGGAAGTGTDGGLDDVADGAVGGGATVPGDTGPGRATTQGAPEAGHAAPAPTGASTPEEVTGSSPPDDAPAGGPATTSGTGAAGRPTPPSPVTPRRGAAAPTDSADHDVADPADPAAPAAPAAPADPAEPAKPAEPATIEGAVLRAWAEPDAAEGGSHDDEPALLTYLDTGTEQVQVPSSALDDVGGNAWVRARLGDETPATGSDDPQRAAEGGRDVLAADVLAPGEPVDEVQAALPAAAAHEVTIAMVAPAGAVRDSATLADVVAAVEGPVSGFWSDQTRQAVSFSVTRTEDWYTSSATCADATGMWNEAAARTGWTAGPGKHLLLYVTTATNLPSCYAGLGTVGSGTTSGGRAYVRGTRTSLVAHELGHNMGLSHSDGLVCSGGADGAWSGTSWGSGCVEQGYRDFYDVMGISWPYLGTLTSQHATFLGAMTGGDRVDVAAPTRAVLAPVSSLTGLRALKVVEGGVTYWVEFRARAGRDSWLDGGNYRSLSSGVLVRRVNPRSARASLLLDVTPSGSTSDYSANLPVAQSFTTAGGRFAVTVEEVGAAGATVAVSVDGVAPTTTTTPTPTPTPTPEPVPEPAPAPGTTLTVQSPREGARLTEGTVRFAGSGTAPEGMLFWELRDGAGTLAQSGFALTGANGEPGTWAVDRVVPAGDWTMAVRVPDDSDGEGEELPWVVRSFSVR